MYKTLEVEIRNSVATVWLNRPQLLNAINLDVCSELTSCFKKLDKDETVSVIVLRGRGKSFCSGADLKWMQETGNMSFRNNVKQSSVGAVCFHTIHTVSKPTMAVVHGAAFGGALGLLSSCDIAISTENAKFCFSEVRLGLAPSTIMPYILTRINQHTAKMLIYTAQQFDGNKALQYGLVDAVCSESELENVVNQTISEIVKGSNESLMESKYLINQLSNQPITKKTIKITAHSISKLKQTSEAQKRLNVFLSKSIGKQ